MKAKWFNIILIVSLLVLGLIPAGGAYAGGGTSDSAKNQPGVDTSSALVQLRGDPLSTYVKTKPTQGKKIDLNSPTVKSYRAQLSAQRNIFKRWLQVNAPKAKITGQFDISVNAVSVQLNGTPLNKLASAPMVQHVEYEGLYYPTADAIADPDLSLISAFGAWNAGGGPANAGAGVKVAIVDTGIDITHPCFSDAGYPAQAQLGDPLFTNNKVIVAKVFNNKTPSRGYTAEALQDHGTHVAGTVACNFNTTASVDGVTIPFGVSGVAPRALLGNYNIFPGAVDNARSEDILNALDAAYADGFDVANMSLGGGAHGIQDLVSIAVNNLDAANMVVAVAAGNSGPGHYTIESPGSAASALTAGASAVGHTVGTAITVGGDLFVGLRGDFPVVATDLTAILFAPTGDSVDGMNTACAALPAGGLTDHIVLLQRGTCSFSTKIRNAQAAGALAVIMANNQPGEVVMASDGTPNQPTIPAYSITQNDGKALFTHSEESTTISVQKYILLPDLNDNMADFSSEGPTDVDFRVKPDVVAPGVNVLSSIPHQFCAAPPCFAFFNGTSMATPHLAGSAAVVRGQHPTWSAAQIRSAIVNTADQDVLKNVAGDAPETDVNIIGAGRENLLSAVSAVVALDPVSVSFGAIPSGSGQASTLTLTLTNLTADPATFALAVGAGDASVAYSLAPKSLSLASGASGSVTVTMQAVKGAVVGDHQGILTISAGGTEVAHAAVYTFIK